MSAADRADNRGSAAVTFAESTVLGIFVAGPHGGVGPLERCFDGFHFWYVQFPPRHQYVFMLGGQGSR